MSDCFIAGGLRIRALKYIFSFKGHLLPPATNDLHRHNNNKKRGEHLNVLDRRQMTRMITPMIGIPQRLADRLKSYAYEEKLGDRDRLFPINRSRAWQIINRASMGAGFNKRIYPHLLRHSDAIERLKQTGKPKALQLHLGHSSTLMTMRYLNTLTQEDAVRINQEVQFEE